MPYKGRSIGKKVKEDKGRKGSMYGQATKSTARVEKELSSRIEKEDKGTLWKRSARRNIHTRIRVMHGGCSSNIYAV